MSSTTTASPAADVLSLERNQLKYLFLASYFDLVDTQRLADETRPFIREYLLNNFRVINDDTLLKYIDYLQEIRLKHMIADRSPDIFKYIKPQFKFKCTKRRMDILKLDRSVFIQPNTTIYATNMFVANPLDFGVQMYRLFARVFPNRKFVNNELSHAVIGGNEGYVFDRSYVDWCGVRLCEVANVQQNNPFPYRLYLIGEQMAQFFIKENIMFDDGRLLLRNFYKGLPMYKSNFEIINSRNFVTKKPNELFDYIQQELNSQSTYVKFIQRDYIFDAGDFPDDLLELLNDHMTLTSVYKFIRKFIEGDELGNDYSEIVFDRVSVDRYRKMIVRIDDRTIFPTLRFDAPSYIFIRPDFVQIRGVRNAFYAPKEHVLGILENNLFFGAKETLEFDFDKLIPYKQAVPAIRVAGEIYSIVREQKIYLTRWMFANKIPVYLLIRGDYESSSSEYKRLNELNNPLVQNAVLQLLFGRRQ
ncbi:hypothetical protein SlsnVgp009 [Spodoptera littoralis nucleopolyhedrovirus]|nr:hypothetical protein SlsnVgp009 [Spodoptera littoralis nucleopolyhedrovirus]AGE89864.1 hypothetical protein SlsnVgp009 [Spodoptera littoralis nucleopolyhedrovirus]